MPSIALLINRFVVGQQGTNCYLAWEAQTNQAIIIDPGDDATTLTERISELNLELTGIYLTHGHFDHVLGLLELQLATGVPFFMHPADAFLLERAQSTAQHFGHQSDPVPTNFTPLAASADHPTTVDLLPDVNATVLHTPGHTPGSVCFLLSGKETTFFFEGEQLDCHQIIFTGDTLLPEEKTDVSHQYSSAKDLTQSFKKLQIIPGDTLVAPGHGELLPFAVYSPIISAFSGIDPS